MKKFILALMIGFGFNTVSYANNVETHLPNIRDRIRACVVIPFTLKNDVKVFHHMISHCPEVRMLERHRAKIKIGGSNFVAQLVENADTDGDFYDVLIRDYQSNDSLTIYNVLAFGDVFRGVLGGDISKVRQVYNP